MQIGRITGLTEPHDWDSTDDDTVRLTADYQSPGLGVAGDGLVVRRQLLSYPNTDEPVIPIILTSDPAMSGYYRPMRTQILTDQLSRIRGHIFGYTMELQRVSGFAQPWIESIVNGGLLTNAVGAVSTDMIPSQSVPSTVIEYAPNATISSYFTRSTDDGVGVNEADLAAGGATQFSSRFYLAPANYYDAACKVRQGSPLAVVVGRGLVQNDLVHWEMSNGLVKVAPNGASKLDVSHWDGGQWNTKTYVLSQAGVNLPNWKSITVLRNAPEMTSIRLGARDEGGNKLGSDVLDLTLRRGDRILRCYLATAGVSAAGWRIAVNTPEAASAITYSAVTTGGIRATVNDANGERYVLLSYQAATTSDLVNGSLQLNPAGTTMDFGTSADPGGTGVTLAKYYLAALSEEQRVVAR